MATELVGAVVLYPAVVQPGALCVVSLVDVRKDRHGVAIVWRRKLRRAVSKLSTDIEKDSHVTICGGHVVRLGLPTQDDE